jgi:AGZA family xanthine/uracil permease-like MFS transporter
MLDRVFDYRARGSSFSTEVLAGITTFLTMAYIVFVNPAILSGVIDVAKDGKAAKDEFFGAVFVATCVAAAIACFVMGFFANFPAGLAPGMGINAFFTFGVVKGMGLSWQIALAAVFVAGLIFLLLSLVPFRRWLINSIPPPLKLAMAAGIGFFLGMIALQSAGVVVNHPATLVTAPTDFAIWPIVLTGAGLVVMTVLNHFKVPGGILLVILGLTVIGIVFQLPDSRGVAPTFTQITSLPPDPSATLLKMDLEGLFQLALLPMVTIIFTFLVVDLFDSAGTIVGLAHQGKLLDENYQMEGLGRPLVADSVGTVAGAALGTSTVTTYIESASGIEAGGKTGLTAVVVGVLFLAALFIAPLAQSIPSYATAAAILFVAAVMSRALGEINWDDATDYVPAVLMALAMPLTFSISAGIGIGFFSYIAIKLLTFRFRDLNLAVLVVGVIFALYFAPTIMKMIIPE